MKGRGGGHGGHAGLAMHGGHHRHAGWGGRPDRPDAVEGVAPRYGRFGPHGHGFGHGHGKWHGHGRPEGGRFAAFGRGMEPAPEARGDFRGVADAVEARSDAPARVAVCAGRSCQARWDSPSLIEDLRREAAASGQRVEVTACGCLDQCRNGPVVVATPAGAGRERAFLRTGSRQASEIIAAVVDRKS